MPEEKRVKMLHKDDAVRVGRFGNEGTGSQCFLDPDWKGGETTIREVLVMGSELTPKGPIYTVGAACASSCSNVIRAPAARRCEILE